MKKKNIKINLGALSSNSTVLKGIRKFKIEAYNIIIEKLFSKLDKRIEVYLKFVSDNFLFIVKMRVPIGDTVNE